jgi:very-short-patch-repair endonuclease
MNSGLVEDESNNIDESYMDEEKKDISNEENNSIRRHYLYREKLKPYAKKLRKEMTKEEVKLWCGYLKDLPITVNRQKSIGKVIVDFYCASAKVVIEVDGSQHYEDEGVQQDLERDRYLKSLGITVLRYSNRDINQNFAGVCEDIDKWLFPK